MAGGPHDEGKRRRALRKGRETGCSIYIPGELLERIGITHSADGGPPYFRTWAGPKRKHPAVIVVLYPEP